MKRLREPLLLTAAAALPFLLAATGNEFYTGMATRMMIFALAATALNLVVGYGGMVAFGHAAFFGLGAYVVAILMQQGVASGWIAWPLAAAVAAGAALLVGLASLRTRGVYFIMITLAFAQMLYYLVLSLKDYGGDDGLPLAGRSTLAPVALADDTVFYLVTLAVLAAALAGLRRLDAARFGRALAGIRQNETRMEALGYPVFRLKLACFVIGGAVAGLAGALMANQHGMASPNQLYWTQSGMLLVMVILGGVGSRYGGLIGAVTLLGLEEILAGYTEHAALWVGVFLLLVVSFAPRGIAGLLAGRRHG
ncbi:MAG: branched-chain amino acid ABC transporter permease [Rhodocyclaceae bacterium]|nr:branched-chain amino acid ABC transporter permease [Rhodocyclaceae bacterium]